MQFLSLVCLSFCLFSLAYSENPLGVNIFTFLLFSLFILAEGDPIPLNLKFYRGLFLLGLGLLLVSFDLTRFGLMIILLSNVSESNLTKVLQYKWDLLEDEYFLKKIVPIVN